MQKPMSAITVCQTIKKPLSKISGHKLLWLSMALVSIMSIVDITGSPIFSGGIFVKALYVVSVSSFKATLITLAYSLCLRNKPLKWGCQSAIAAYSLLAAVNIIGYGLYGFGLTRKLILAFAQTTPTESLEFICSLWANISHVLNMPATYLVCGTIILLFYLVNKSNERCFNAVTLTLSTVGAIAFAIFCLTFSSGKTAHSLFARSIKYGYEVALWENRYRDLTDKHRPLPYAETVTSRHTAEYIVVVIGESASRNHHSVYGYTLPTNPRLGAMKDSIFIFTDVIGSSSGTSDNIERILSFKEDDAKNGDGLDYPLVVDLFNQAGYKTFWLSNQERYGNVSNTSGVMAMNASVINYVGADNSEDALVFKYDEALLPAYRNALNDTTARAKMIFIHLLGSHSEYRQRFPEDFGRFTAQDELRSFPEKNLDKAMARRRAEYDNSILYTDSLLGEIIDKISRSDKSAIVIYLSDHGENVYDEGLLTGRGEKFVEIPFIVYANRTFRTHNPGVTEMIGKAVDKPFSSANLAHMLVALTGTTYKYYNPQRDVLSPNYVVKPRYVNEKIWPYDKCK